MKWFKRACWLAACGLWLWMGFGLYRELPREPGPKTCKSEVAGSSVLGFVGDSDTIALNMRSNRPTGKDLALVDGRNGNEVGRLPMPDLPPMVFYQTLTLANLTDKRAVVMEQSPGTLCYGILLGNGGPGRRSNPGLYALNVENGERKQLTTYPVIQIVLHPSEPIVAIVGGEFGGVADRITVVNYRSGEMFFDLAFPKQASLYARPYFVPSCEAVVLSLLQRSNGLQNGHKETMQVWKFTKPPRLVKEWSGEDAPPMMPLSVSSTGRVLFQGRLESDDPDAKWVDVYDFNEERCISTLAQAEQPKRKDGAYTPPKQRAMMISADGRTVLKYDIHRKTRPGVSPVPIDVTQLCEVDTGRTIWSSAAPNVSTVPTADQTDFWQMESWQDALKQWFPKVKLRTYVLRSMGTGELKLRFDEAYRFDPRNINSTKTLVVLADGSVHRLPFWVNWPLLALCQTVLTLPLVMIWTVSKWRRRRRQQALEQASSD